MPHPRKRMPGSRRSPIHITQPGVPGNLLVSSGGDLVCSHSQKGAKLPLHERFLTSGRDRKAKLPGPRPAALRGLLQLHKNELPSSGPWNQPSVLCPSSHLTLIGLALT